MNLSENLVQESRLSDWARCQKIRWWHSYLKELKSRDYTEWFRFQSLPQKLYLKIHHLAEGFVFGVMIMVVWKRELRPIERHRCCFFHWPANFLSVFTSEVNGRGSSLDQQASSTSSQVPIQLIKYCWFSFKDKSFCTSDWRSQFLFVNASMEEILGNLVISMTRVKLSKLRASLCVPSKTLTFDNLTTWRLWTYVSKRLFINQTRLAENWKERHL